MAKKKLSTQPNQEEAELQPSTMETTKEIKNDSSLKPSPPPPPSEEKVANLKSLNALLVKETVERREQVESLMRSKTSLESEVSRFESENRRLEEEKKVLEGKVAEVEALEKLALEELERRVEEKEEEIIRVRDEFVRFREKVEKDLEMKVEEERRLKDLVEELEKSNGEDQEELREMTIAYNGVIEQKKGLQGQIADLKTVMEEIGRDRSELEKVKREQDVEVSKLKKTVDDLRIDVERERSCIEGVVREKETIAKNVEMKVKEVEGLNSKIVELEKRNSAVAESDGKREKEVKKLVEEKMERERAIESLTSEKVSVERRLEDSMKLVEDLNRKMRQLQEKTEGEKTMHLMKIAELESSVENLHVSLSNLQKEKEGLVSKVAEIRENYDGALEKQSELRKELGLVVEEKGEKERAYELLMADKNSTASRLDEALGQLESQAKEIEVIGKEKSEVECVKNALEIKIEELQKEVTSFKASESALQESCEEQSEKINQLEYEVVCLKDNLGKVTTERDGVLKELDLKKEEEARLTLKVSKLEKTVEEQSRKIDQLECEVVGFKDNLGKVTTERDAVLKELGLRKDEEAKLKLKVSELEKSVEKGRQELEKLKKEHGSLSAGKKEKETQIQLLINEKSLLEKRLLKVEQDNKELVSKVKTAEILSGKALSMLKSTAGFVSGSEDAGENGKVEDAGTVEQELRQFASELEAIKRAFKNKEKNDEDLALQITSLNNSLAEAQKRKNIWTWLSSATTLFAAASVAYAARAR